MNFKVITGYPDHLISESGEIFSLKSNRNLKPYKTTKGYLQVIPCRSKAQIPFTIKEPYYLISSGEAEIREGTYIL